MKTKRLVFVVVAVASMFPLLQILADAPVTFEVLLTVDYPGATSTEVNGINERGDVGGFFANESDMFRGFVRFSDGHFSGPITAPTYPQAVLEVSGINSVGAVCGSYISGGYFHGFLLSGSTFTDITAGPADTLVESVNSAGNFCGYTNPPQKAFVSIGGSITFFTIPGSSNTSAFGMNNLNQVVGSYTIGYHQFGFLREADGTLIYPIGHPTGGAIYLLGINDGGLMVGMIFDGARFHAIFFRAPGRFALYDYPGANYTRFNGINKRGQISGTYIDDSGAHGLIVRVRPATGE